MKRILSFFIFVLILSCLFFVVATRAVNYPSPVGHVNDFAQLYSEPFRQQLEQNLTDFEKQTTAELAVTTIASLEGEPIEDYAVELFKRWQIGKKGQDNGLLLLISRDDRNVRIEVGYGLEPTVPDGFAGEVIRTKMIPAFKEGNYEKGTKEAVDTLEARILGQTVDISPIPEAKVSAPDIPVMPLIFFGYIFFTYLSSYLGRTKEIWPGGVIGGIFGAIAGYFLVSVIVGIIGAVLLGLIGLLLDFILSRNYRYRASQGLPTGFWPSSGGFSSGRGFGGGGFGGFGGGRSGGGGASGRW